MVTGVPEDMVIGNVPLTQDKILLGTALCSSLR